MVEELLRRVETWAEREAAVEALALVGSHARGEAKPDSDVDLLLLSNDSSRLLEDRSWTEGFGVVEEATLEGWGRVTSVRVKYEGGLEVEFGVATPDWATRPDSGTKRVVSEGLRVLWDPAGIFALLRQSALAPHNGLGAQLRRGR